MNQDDPIEHDYLSPRNDPDARKSNPIILAIVGIVVGIALLLAPGICRYVQIHMVPAPNHFPRNDIASIKTALQKFEIENGRLPTTDEGISELITDSSHLPAWSKCLDMQSVPLDPWGHPHIYRFPGSRVDRDYDLLSTGPDGIEGTADDIVPQ